MSSYMTAGPWQTVDGYCAARVRVGGNPDKVTDRLAFIQKTPKVRIREHSEHYAVDDAWNWAEGQHFKGNDASDPEARAWCDRVLLEMGYDLKDNV